MGLTLKHEKIAAFRQEKGKLASSAFQYGGSTIMSLGSGHAIPYTSISIGGSITTTTDDSIEGQAHKDIPILSGITAPMDSWEGNLRYQGMDRLLYWMFGWERPGTSPVSLGGGYYSHLYELDRYETEFLPYRSDEQTAIDYHATDRKNRYSVLGLKLGSNDYRYPFLICSGFSFSSEASGILKWNAKGLAYREDRGNYNSAAWTFENDVAGSSLVIPHHNLVASIGPIGGSLSTIGLKSVSVNVDKPQYSEQDSMSGLYNGEPVLSGQYETTINLLIARHSVDTYLSYRDSGSELCLKLVWTSGSYVFALYFPSVKIGESSISEDDVARNPINLIAGKPSSNPFSSDITGHTLIQNGSIYCVTKNKNNVNEMRRE